jgi:ribonuclease R
MTAKFKSGSRKLPQRFLQQAILKLLRKKSTKFYNAKTIVQKLGVKNSRDSAEDALRTLYSKGKLLSDGQGRYGINPKNSNSDIRRSKNLYNGRIEVISNGAGFVIVEGLDQDVYIPKKYVYGALHGDTVRIESSKPRPGRRPEGKVVDIVTRGRTAYIGIFRELKKYGLVYIDDGKAELEVKVLPKDYKDAEEGSAVVVEIYDFGEENRNQKLGRITATINKDDRNDFEMNSILLSNGFDIQFPEQVLAETAQLNDVITDDDLAHRRDLREWDIFTIDPVDAKDFDDALSYIKHDNGDIEIGIHIADVTHFVKPGTTLDQEAYSRSTSVYLVDRVCPMLPERISNELCSLRPNEDKFAFSAIFIMDPDLKIKSQWFGKTLIHSKRRFTYEEAQEVIDQNQGDYAEELKEMNRIAKHLKKKRFEKGSIDFESDEVRFVLDEDKKPVDVMRKVRGDSHKLVEEFMLLANRRTAKYVAKKSKNEIPNVYRVHDTPDPEKLQTLATLAMEFGIKLNLDTPKNITQSLNNLTQNLDDEGLKSILRPMAIRCMAKAVYSSDNIGHYGLGFSYYTHFTSPIRRYSDVLVHRILQANLVGELRLKTAELEEKCQHISAQERNATSAERESIKYKQVEYLGERIGEELEGTIRNIIDKGIFIELTESQADGMVRFDDFDEPFDVHSSQIKATGMRSGLVLRIGDRIKVSILSVDMDKKQADFSFVSKLDGNQDQNA